MLYAVCSNVTTDSIWGGICRQKGRGGFGLWSMLSGDDERSNAVAGSGVGDGLPPISQPSVLIASVVIQALLILGQRTW